MARHCSKQWEVGIGTDELRKVNQKQAFLQCAPKLYYEV